MRADSTDEFLAAATRLFETARPWLTAALAEHTAHSAAEPGACRLCALRGALIAGAPPFAALAAESFGHFADDVVDDLRALVDELLDAVRQTYTGVVADYLATMQAAAPAAAEPPTPESDASGTDESAVPPVATETAPETSDSGTGGYERIAITLDEDSGDDL